MPGSGDSTRSRIEAAIPAHPMAMPARTPSQLRDAPAGRAYQLTGRVVPGYHREGDVLVFRVRDRNGPASAPTVPVRYAGAVPDPFRQGREVVVTVRRRGAVFVGEKDSLVTKCPSKFSDTKGQ